MKGFIKSKKGFALLATMVVAAVGAVAGYAYFTSTGNGTGSVAVGTASSWVVGQATGATGGPLYPDSTIGGTNVQTDPYTIANTNAGNQELTNVVIDVANSNGGTWTAQVTSTKPACSAADFSVGGQPVGTPWTDTSAAGDFTAGQSKTEKVSVEMIDNGSNQDNCQGVTVPLYFSAS